MSEANDLQIVRFQAPQAFDRNGIRLLDGIAIRQKTYKWLIISNV